MRHALVFGVCGLFACGGAAVVDKPVDPSPAAGEAPSTLPPMSSAAPSVSDPPPAVATVAPSAASSEPTRGGNANARPEGVRETDSESTAGASSASSPPDSLSHGDIARIIAMARPKYRRCYEAALKRVPDYWGAFVIKLSILPNGSVGPVTLAMRDANAKDTIDAGFRTCIVQATKALRFPSFSGTPVQISVPLVFAKKTVD